MKLKQSLFILFSFLLIASSGLTPGIVKADVNEVIEIVFPVLGGGQYSNDYDSPRGGGRTHMATDIMASKMQPLLAAVDGRITFLPTTEPSYGWTLTITDSKGYQYNYLHINNDTPGTDDGQGGYNNAFAPGISQGDRVVAGQRIAFVGDSGNAEEAGAHLHFEIEDPDGVRINPYYSLRQAEILFNSVENNNDDDRSDEDEEEDKDRRNNDDDEEDEGEDPARVEDSFFPYDQFEGGANITSGNIDGDRSIEVITGTAFGGGGRTIVKVYDQRAKQQYEWFAYGDVFRGGMDVASADVDGDGKAEIITVPGPTGGPHVKIFKPNGDLVSEFMAYDAGFRGGVYISAADVDGDGKAEIVTAPGATGGPHVKVFDSTGELKTEWMAYDGAFRGGVDVTAFSKIGRVDGGISTAPGATGGPHVKTFNIKGELQDEFMAYEDSYRGGVRVDGGNTHEGNGVMEVAVASATSSGHHIKIFTTTGRLQEEFTADFGGSWTGGYDVAIAGKRIYVATSGGRKTEVKAFSF